MKQRFVRFNKLSKKVALTALPTLLLVTTAASCGTSENNNEPKTDFKSTDTTDWYAAVDEPKLNPNKIALMSEDESIAYITRREDDGGTMLANAINERIKWSDLKNRNEIDVNTFFELKHPDGSRYKISDLGVEALTGVPSLMTNVLAGIVDLVWQVPFDTRIILTHKNLVSEMLRLTNSDFSGLAKLNKVFSNFTEDTKTGDEASKKAWFSWEKLVQFVRIALDPTPEGNYSYEGLIAMLKPIGKTALEAFNENAAKRYVRESETSSKNVGGLSGKKINLNSIKTAS